MSETGPAAPPGARPFGERVLGALRLDATVYEEVEHDRSALGQAALVVGLAAVAAAIGVQGGVVGTVVGSILGWLVSAGLVWLVGVFWLEHSSDYPELLRTLGFASAPQLLLVLGGVPVVGALALLAALAWGLAAYVIAVRQALDVATGRAVLVCLLAFGLRVLAAGLLRLVA